MIGFIYKTTCLVNGKIYIGRHEGSENDGYIGSGVRFTCAVKKYGRENFKREILRYCNSENELSIWEYVFIKKFKSQDPNIGYNIAEGNVNEGKYNPAKIPEIRNKMIEVNRRTTSDLNYRKRQSEIMKEYYKTHPAAFAGKHHSEEVKRKISEAKMGKPSANKGVPASEEQKRKQSEKMKGRYLGEKNPNYGNKWTEEQRKHLSDVKKGLKPSKNGVWRA